MTNLKEIGMVTFREVWKIALGEPFHPFRIRTTSGRAFEIHDPKVAAVGIKTLTLSTWLADIPDVKGPWLHIPLEEIESIERLHALTFPPTSS